MGIQGLYPLIKAISPKSLSSVCLTALAQKSIALDASILHYQFLTSMSYMKGDQVQQMKDTDGNLTGHLMGMLNRLLWLQRNNIEVTVIFDGKADESKQDLLQKRKEKKEYNQGQLQNAIESKDREGQLKFQKRAIFVSSQMQQDSVELVKLMGVPYLIAPQEAEAQCAYLQKRQVVHFANSQDLDCLPFGAEWMVRHLKSSNEDCIELIHRAQILEDFGMDEPMFIDFCILLGCDFSPKISNMGPKTSLKLIQKYKSIEEILLNEKKFSITGNFAYQIARDQFMKQKLAEPGEIQKHKYDKERLREFLQEKKGFKEKRVSKVVEELQQLSES